MEYCRFSVADFFNENNEPDVSCARNQLGAREVLRQSTEGLAFLHGYGYLHRNLKPDNFRVAKYQGINNKHVYQIKLTGFKYAKDIKIKTNVNNSGTHDIIWYAPECKFSNVDLHWWVDVFVLGKYYFYVLFGGHHPFQCTDTVQNKGKKLTKTETCEEIQNERHEIYSWANNTAYGDVRKKIPWGEDWLKEKYTKAWKGTAGFKTIRDSGESIKEAFCLLRLIKTMMRYCPYGRPPLRDVIEDPFFKPVTNYPLYSNENKPGLCLVFCQSEFTNKVKRIVFDFVCLWLPSKT